MENTLIGVLLLCAYASASPRFHPPNENEIIIENFDGHYEIVNLEEQVIELEATLDDITYNVYTKSNPEIPHQIFFNNIDDLAESNFDKTKPTVFIIHGWRNDNSSTIFQLLVPAILENDDVNIIGVDWRKPAHSNYLTAKAAVPTVGEYVAEFINLIMNYYEVPSNRFILIGHSLGAHACGKAGSLITEGVSHIIGLDPARPLFSATNIDDRLDPTDAPFVHVIHTCGQLLGFLQPIGHADYYPNEGEHQPGCGWDLTGSCSHSRSYMYLTESIRNSTAFPAVSCEDFTTFQSGLCFNKEISNMGGLYVNKKASGDYFLNTNGVEPFSL